MWMNAPWGISGDKPVIQVCKVNECCGPLAEIQPYELFNQLSYQFYIYSLMQHNSIDLPINQIENSS